MQRGGAGRAGGGIRKYDSGLFSSSSEGRSHTDLAKVGKAWTKPIKLHFRHPPQAVSVDDVAG